MQLLDVITHFLLQNGVGQNITAGVLMAIPAAIWARVKLVPKLREHHRRVRELHELLVKEDSSHEPTHP